MNRAKKWMRAIFYTFLPVGFLALTSNTLIASESKSESEDEYFTIKKAIWKYEENRLIVKGKGGEDLEVVLMNSATEDVIESVVSKDDDWRFKIKIKDDAEVPCKVSAKRSADGAMDEMRVKDAPDNCKGDMGGGNGNMPPIAIANGPYSGSPGEAVDFSSEGSSDPEMGELVYLWDFGDGNTSNDANPSHVYSESGIFQVMLSVKDSEGAATEVITVASIQEGGQPMAVSINSTSQNGIPGEPVPEQPLINTSDYRVFAVNDLGMHCGDFDTRISSILPPFNVLHATVIRRGLEPEILGPDDVDVYYSAASNPQDPIITTGLNSAQSGPVYSSRNTTTGEVFKTNFWDVARDAYDPFYPPGILPAFYPAGPVEG
ncbi:MAG: PKD domain-containing protein, partial [Candidatus Thiodiazotropha taylori]